MDNRASRRQIHVRGPSPAARGDSVDVVKAQIFAARRFMRGADSAGWSSCCTVLDWPSVRSNYLLSQLPMHLTSADRSRAVATRAFLTE